MDEARLQAYVNLIEQLLTCANGEELNNILQANQELIDPQFLQEMENYATWLEQQGNNNPAAWLRDMAQQLGQYLNPQAYPTQQQPSNQLPQTVYVLLYNVGTDNEGIHTISKDDKHTILIFESSADATNFARQLGEQIGEQNFPVPSVEAMEAEEIFWFCKKSGYDWEFVAQGTDRTPPSQNQKTVYVLLYNAGTDNEGIHTITHQGRHTILMFESSSDATHFARQLRDQNFPMPSVDTIEAKTIISFCEEVGYDWEFVPEGANRTPPVNSEVGDKADKLETAISCYQENPKVYSSEALSYDRLQAYVNLIEQLLACANDEERTNILQANQELIDPEFLQVMEIYATGLEQQGNNNDADCLRQYFKLQAVNRSEYQAFLLELLQVEYIGNNDPLEVLRGKYIRSDDGEPSLVYPILERGQHLLDDTFAQLLQEYTRNVFSQGNAEQVADTAEVIGNLCHHIQQFPLGSRANNLEIAIVGYYALLEGYTREAFPYEWARSQNNLGIVYCNRIRGERADNLELAITAYNQSLEVFTRDAFLYEWAVTQNNLGGAYLDRIRGERADNLELAIVAHNLSLEVLTREAFPEDWANTQINLGNAYQTRIRGERAENLELAIAAYNQSLEVYTREDFLYEWAVTQNNLGIVYCNRIRGERADSLELAIAAHNLSLEVLTREAFPYEWALTQINLGRAYSFRIRREKANNLELAISAVKQSLEVYTHEAFPEQWAMTQNNLGQAYINRILGARANNLELAISAVKQSLEVYTRQAFPEYWARSQSNLGIAYGNRIRGERADNLELAIAAFNLSLEVYTPTAFPINSLGTGLCLGITANLIEDWETAIKGYNLAIEGVENTRLEALNPTFRRLPPPIE